MTLLPDVTRSEPGPTLVGRVWGTMVSARGELNAALVAGGLLGVGFVLKHGAGLAGVGEGLYWASLALGMFHGGRAAFAAVRAGKFDIDVLMVVGAGLAAWVGAPGEGALLLFLFVLSGALEALATARTRRAVTALHRLMPTSALRLAGAGAWEPVEPEVLAAGDRVKVLPGEVVPTDAEVLTGASSVDQSSLTGESVPRDVGPGDAIFAGTINVGSAIEARVQRPAAESSLQRILNLVIEAQQQREPVQRAIDRISGPYAWGVAASSVAVLLIWWLGLGRPLIAEGGGAGAIYTAITLLIVMSPCALIISTPTATLAAVTRGARGGVLFKGGQAIERLSRVTAVAFDKTGTLTVGKPRVEQIHPIGWSDESALLAVAAGLEAESTHPIARAIMEAARARGVEPARISQTSFVPGRGVAGEYEGKESRLGTLVYAGAVVPTCLRARVREVLEGVQDRGHIGTVVAWNEHAGVVVLGDRIRPGARELVSRLHALGVRPVCMLTGDNANTARHVAESLGIDQWRAELLPGDKVEAVRQMRVRLAGARRSKAAVGVIGDGVNDAPALAAADVAIAIGSIGSDAALESADIVLLTDDLGVVPWAVRLARSARRVVTTNIVFSLSAIIIMAIGTIVGSLIGTPVPLWLGVVGHEGGTLLVVANSLSLLALRGVRTATLADGLPTDQPIRAPQPAETAV